MFSDKVFQITLLISALTHTVILFQNADLNLFPANKKTQEVNISYIKEPEKNLEYPKPAPLKKEPFLKIPSQITAENKNPPPFIERENIFQKTGQNILSESSATKPAFMKPDIIAIKKKITFPAVGPLLDVDKINNPSYISYYQIVREKIKRAAYQNYTRTEEGEAYLTFIISNEGRLTETRLVPEKSSANPYLCEIALRSLKDASPFPNFPKELDYPQLSFNVVISFEIE